jgi:hypothetical protein
MGYSKTGATVKYGILEWWNNGILGLKKIGSKDAMLASHLRDK